MRDEISKLLEKEGILSKESLKELSQLDIHKFFDNVKELGEEKTDHIQKEKITKDLNTSFIGKEIYIFKEVMSTNTVAKFFAENKVSDGTVIISEKQTNAKGNTLTITPVGAGSTSITVKETNGNATVEIQIEVKETTLTATPQNVTAYVGGSKQTVAINGTNAGTLSITKQPDSIG